MPDLERLLPDTLSPLAQVTLLLLLALGVLLLLSILLYFFYQLVQRAAIEFEVSLIEQLRTQARGLATIRTLSAQQTALTDCLDYHLPRVRASLNRWWRVFPRHVVQWLACVAVAIAIQPTLGLLTLTAVGLVAVSYRGLDRWRRTRLPVIRERAAQERQMLVDLSLQGPLLESVHQAAAIEKRFNDQLNHYRQDAVRSLISSAWKTPALLLSAGTLVCLFLFVVAVQILRSETSFSVPGALAFSLCVAAAAVSARRLVRAWRDLQSVETAARRVGRLPFASFENAGQCQTEASAWIQSPDRTADRYGARQSR
jgi:ABC-type multidrug transport system fused ATPase/permease subunit